MITTVVRNASDKSWKSRTIKSGTTISQLSDGTRIEKVFDQLKFTSSDKCVAESGKITGIIFNGETETTASKTYVISYDDGVATITYSDGTTAEYAPQGCDLDRSTESAE